MQFIRSLLLVAMLAHSCSAFVVQPSPRPATKLSSSQAIENVDTSKFYFMEEKKANIDVPSPKPEQAAKTPANKYAKKPQAHGKNGVFSPAVLFVKDIWGDETEFNKFRAKVISMHSDVISSFVDTSDTPTGRAVLKTLFQLVDKDRSGTIEEEELADAFTLLGFDWLKEKQLKGIFSRADKDGNGRIDIDEWFSEAPATLRTNLIKLAKKNGGEMGLLA